MSNRYTGNRYVPKVLSITDSWNKDRSYESLTVVTYQGASYTSRQYIPIGVEITNTDFWVCTGNYNAQVEQYRQDTLNAVKNVNIKLDSFSNTQDGKFQILMNQYKEEINEYADGKYYDINQQIGLVNQSLENAKNDNLAIKTEFLLMASELLEIKALSFLNNK